MARLVTYLLTMFAGLAFWVIELLANYRDYVGHSPFDLQEQYQRTFLFQRSQLIMSELAFPVMMILVFLLLLIFKFFAKSVRITLGFMLFVCTEFWVWRSFVFSNKMGTLYLQNEAENPVLVPQNDFRIYIVGFGLLFLLVIFLREYPLGQDQDALHARLRRSLEKGKW